MDLDLRLAGDFERLTDMQGGGSIRVEESALWAIPVFQALSTRLGIDTTVLFRTMLCDYAIADGELRLERMRVDSDLLSLVGEGAINFEGDVAGDLEVRYGLVDRLGPLTSCCTTSRTACASPSAARWNAPRSSCAGWRPSSSLRTRSANDCPSRRSASAASASESAQPGHASMKKGAIAIDHAPSAPASRPWTRSRTPAPLETVTGGDAEALEAMERLLGERDVTHVIVGYPLNMDGGGRAKVDRFVERLRARFPTLVVRLQDERLSTKEAEERLADAGYFGADRKAEGLLERPRPARGLDPRGRARGPGLALSRRSARRSRR